MYETKSEYRKSESGTAAIIFVWLMAGHVPGRDITLKTET